MHLIFCVSKHLLIMSRPFKFYCRAFTATLTNGNFIIVADARNNINRVQYYFEYLTLYVKLLLINFIILICNIN